MADISVIKLPNGSEYNIVDNTSGYATLASPNFTGTPTAPTPTASDNSTKIATTAYVDAALASQTETDPIFTASVAAGITSSDITNWNNKADEYTAGDGIDITNNVISTDFNFTVQGDTVYIQYTEPIDVTE